MSLSFSVTTSENLARRCDGISRRDFVRVGSLSAFGVALGHWFSARTAPAAARQPKSCILIWLDGGPSHLDTFDLKPHAPAEVRGPFQPISTTVPGIEVSELLPRIAQQMQHVALIRSMTSPLGEHNFGTHYMLTGYKPTPVIEYPSYGSVLAHLREGQGVLPSHIAVPSFRVGGGRISGYGFLPESTRPFSVGSDPANRNFQVRDLDFFAGLNRSRIDRRRDFLAAFDEFSRRVEQSPPSDDQASSPQADTTNAAFEQAYRLVTSPTAKQAFDLSQESAATKRRYGTKSIGQSCLLARRLVERGVPFVTVSNPGWDTHANAYTRLKEGYTGARVPVGLVPSLDLAFSALVQDLRDRGRLDDTLIVVMGEFGRTPKLNTAAGRDHWPRVFSVALAGGGVSGGQVVGSSDSVGEGPQDRPVTPADLACTIYTLLGVDPRHQMHTGDGRPIYVNQHGKPVEEVLA